MVLSIPTENVPLFTKCVSNCTTEHNLFTKIILQKIILPNQVDDIKLFVLDEADEMLSRGFKEQIHDIFTCLPSQVQVALFSATMANDILDLTTKFMINPVRILVKKDQLTLEGIRQFYIAIDKEDWKLGKPLYF